MGELIERLKAKLARYLSPEDSVLEVVGGVIVVLATANTLTVTRDRAGEDAIISAAFAVAVAWGLVDAGLGLLGTVYHRKHWERIVRDAGSMDSDRAASLLAGGFDEDLTALADPGELNAFAAHLAAQTRLQPKPVAAITRADLASAGLTALLMFSATLPLTLPLYLIDDPETGVLAMNAMAFGFLFLIGYLWADYTTMRRVKLGLALGSVALALTVVAVMFD